MSIYLDHNATTPVAPEVLDAILPAFKENFGNASSIHQVGQKARKSIEDARVELAKLIHADSPDEIVFTSGGTESNNMAIKGALGACTHGGKRFVSTAIEHSAVRNVMQHLVEKRGADSVVLPVQPNGIVSLKDVDEAITPDTVLVSIMLANNEVGTIQPIAEIADICKRKNVLFHTDAVQAAGKIDIDVNKLGVDMLSLSGHKFSAPKGTGILYIRKGTRLAGLIQGGKQEKNRRGGTENVAGIIGIGVAAKLAQQGLTHHITHIRKLRDMFEKMILSKIPLTSVNGDLEKRTCNTTNICFEYTDSSALLMALDLGGVVCSNGSACAAGNPEASHVLLAMGLAQDKAHASLRFSFSHINTEVEIHRAVEIIAQTVARLRKTHPLWKESA